MSDVDVKRNDERSRYEVVVDGHTALVAFERRSDGTYEFTHTEVPPELEGRGIAGAMVRAALEEARREQRKVIPSCQYVASYIKRHQEYADLVSE